jgi:PleD family two-component response regulator
MMEGTIQVESEPGWGSTFRVELFAEVAEQFQAGAWGEIEEIVVVGPDQPAFRILVIEDDPTNRLLLKRVLEGAGFQIRAAEKGETGIGIFSEWHPHFIWLDMQLPGMNGLELPLGTANWQAGGI